MGQLHNELRRGIWSRAVRSALWVDDAESGIERFGETLTPVLDLWGRPEFARLRDEQLLMGSVDGLAAGAAGQRSQIALDNPPLSQSLVVLERIWISTAQALTLALSQTQLTTSTGNLVARDTRDPITTGASVPHQSRIRTQNNAALANVASELGSMNVADSYGYRFDLVLAPGWSFRIFPTADATAITPRVTFMVRERRASRGELG